METIDVINLRENKKFFFILKIKKKTFANVEQQKNVTPFYVTCRLNPLFHDIVSFHVHQIFGFIHKLVNLNKNTKSIIIYQ